MLKKISTSITVAVYNSERNLSILLESLLLQNKVNFNLKQITVYSDHSTDKSNNIASTYARAHKIIRYIKGKRRKGFANVVKYLFRYCHTDILIILNDDIIILDNNFLKKLLNPFNDPKVGFVTGNPNPLRGVNFVQTAANSSFNAFFKMRNALGNKNNKFTCDGKVMAFSKEFIESLKLPSSAVMGNVDAYLYFAAITSKYLYKHVREARVFYKNPLTTTEYIKWMTRNNSNRYILDKYFGSIVEKEYKPISKIWLYKFAEFIKNPLAGIYLFSISVIVLITSKNYAKNFNPLWETIRTTKI